MLRTPKQQTLKKTRPSMTPHDIAPPTKILLIDDDKKLCSLIADYLEPMDYQVRIANNGPQGLQMIRENKYDAVILDVMMPGMDGFEVLRQIRTYTNVPILMLSARDEETDRIVGLEMGADDYLPKTFSSREILARLRAVIRRSTATQPQFVPPMSEHGMVIGALEIDENARSVHLKGKPLELTPIEYGLLICLAKAAGRVLSRDQLMDAIAGRDCHGFDRSIDVHISSLRRKLGEDPRKPRYIKTIRSVGYMFSANQKRL